jgi:Glutathione S-transferase, N-terminal domain
MGMKLYVCWGTFDMPGGHPCATALKALKDAGYRPEVIRAYGAKSLPPFLGFLNQTDGRRAVKRLTGSVVVPALVTDTGEVLHESDNIVAWARAHSATVTEPSHV